MLPGAKTPQDDRGGPGQGLQGRSENAESKDVVFQDHQVLDEAQDPAWAWAWMGGMETWPGSWK